MYLCLHSSSFPFQADQICYAVLCVFSYVAAGRQDQKKGVAGGAHQAHSNKKAAPTVEQKASTAPPKSPVIGIPQQSPLEVLAITPTAVQPPSVRTPTEQIFVEEKKPETGNGTIPKQQAPNKNPSPAASPAPVATPEPPQVSSPPPKEAPPVIPATTKPPGKLPQVPPRVQSQGSINRGPPPAIPPRPQAVLQRAGTVQIQSKPPMTRTTLTRQQSATSVPPQYTPQPPPKFVIPQRQNSRTSLQRQQSNSSGGSPQSPKKY